MDARIILAGQGVNALQALTDGTQAAGLAGQVGQQGDLLSLYRQQGPGIAAGDRNALNALSQIDPMQALGVQESRQGMQIREEQLQMARAAAARQAEEYARGISAEQREQERRQLEQGLASAIPAIQSGNLEQVNQILRTGGMQPVGSMEEAQLMLAQAEGVFETFQRFNEMTQGPRVNPTDDIREFQFAQQQGFTGTFQEWMTRNQQGLTVYDPISGNMIAQMGGSGQAPAPAQTPMAPIPIQPVQGAADALGFDGLLRRGANAAADVVGVDVPFPDVLNAQATMNLTGEDLLNSIASGYARQPPSWLLEEIRNLVPRAQGVTGSQTAVAQYQAIRRRLETDASLARESLRTAARNPTQAAELQDRIRGAATAISMIDQIVAGIEGTGSGMTDDDAALIQRYLD